MLQHMPRVRPDRRQPQPRQPGEPAALLAFEKILQALTMVVRKSVGQGGINAPVGLRNGPGTDALDNIERRNDDVLLAQCIQHTGSQHDSLVGLQSQIGHGMHGLA